MAEDPRSILERNKRLLADRAKTQESEELLEKLPQGHGSGLNADMVDGQHAAEIIAKAPGKGGGGGGSGAGSGDMTKAVYDQNENGVVDNSEKLEGSTKGQVQDHAPKEHGNEAHNPDMATVLELAIHEASPDIHHAQSHTLASHSTKTHSELTGVTADQHADTKVRSKVVDEAAIGDDKILVYKVASDTLVYEAKPSGGGTPESILMGCMFKGFGGFEIFSTGGTVVKGSWGAKVTSVTTPSPYVGYAFYDYENLDSPNIFDKNPQFELYIYKTPRSGTLIEYYVLMGGSAGAYGTASHKKFGIKIMGNNLYIRSSDGTTQTDSSVLATLNDNTWYRIKCKLDASKVEVWVDGVSVGTKDTNRPSGSIANGRALLQVISRGWSDDTNDIAYGGLKVMHDY